MQINDYHGSETLKEIQKVFAKNKKQIFYVLLYSLLMLAIGSYLYKVGLSTKITNAIKTNLKYGLRNIDARLNARPKKIFVDIKHKDFQRIAFQREKSLETGLRVSMDNDYVPAKITYKDLRHKAKIRLKGIHSDHWVDPLKWSLRVKLKGNKKNPDSNILGMRNFSLVHPATRDLIHEWIYMQMLKAEGLIALKLEFVDVTVNGKNHGIYTLEEHYSPELISSNKRPRGPIIGFNKDLLEAELRRFRKEDRREIKHKRLLEQSLIGNSAAFESSPITASGMKEIRENPQNKNLFLQAISLLEDFRASKLKASEVFDIDKAAKFLAIKAICGSLSFDQNDIKFYYNPITSKLELIGSELHYGARVGKWWVNEKDDIKKPFVDLFFNDPVFFKAYLKALQEFSQEEYLKKFFRKIQDDLNKNLQIIYLDYGDYKFRFDDYLKNQEYIRNMLNPAKAVHAYLSKTGTGFVDLEIGNIQALPIELISLSYQDEVFPLLSKNKTLSPKKIKELVQYQIFSFKTNENFQESKIKDLKLNYKVAGLSGINSVTVFDWKRFDAGFSRSNTLKEKTPLSNFDFIEIDEKEKAIYIKEGSWILTENLVFDPGYKVFAGPGTKLRLDNNAKIISNSALEFIGSERQVIVIEATDDGQGLVVQNTQGVSRLNNIIFKNLKPPKQAGWQLNSAVSFYDADFELNNALFLGSKDIKNSLDIFKSDFLINKSIFKTSYNAIRADHSQGKILESRFDNYEHKALSIFESEIRIDDSQIDKSKESSFAYDSSSNLKIGVLK